MARFKSQNMTAGVPVTPKGLPKAVLTEWDRLIGELADSNIRVAKAHGRLILQAATAVPSRTGCTASAVRPALFFPLD